jgi:hypothetical protein
MLLGAKGNCRPRVLESLERQQKRKQGFLFRWRQFFERIGNFGGFTAVAANGVR